MLGTHSISLQKQTDLQSGCPGCRLAREMVDMHGLFLVIDTNCIRQHERQLPSSSYNHKTLTTLRTSVRESHACI